MEALRKTTTGTMVTRLSATTGAGRRASRRPPRPSCLLAGGDGRGIQAEQGRLRRARGALGRQGKRRIQREGRGSRSVRQGLRATAHDARDSSANGKKDYASAREPRHSPKRSGPSVRSADRRLTVEDKTPADGGTEGPQELRERFRSVAVTRLTSRSVASEATAKQATPILLFKKVPRRGGEGEESQRRGTAERPMM